MWENLEGVLNQQPEVDLATLQAQLREKTTVLPILQLPAGEEYYLPRLLQSAQPPPSPAGSKEGDEDMTTSGSRVEEDMTTDDELANWPRALRVAETNLIRTTEDEVEISQYDELLLGDFLKF